MHTVENTEKRGLRENYYLKAFLLGLGLSFLVFIPFIVFDSGRFLFYGDFNVQQVPFYRLAHDAVRSGNIGWSHLTDLGANFIGSYSFYLLGSPFFWMTIPFPSEWVQYLMGPLLLLKFACATLAAYVYIHRYTKNRETALLCALLYAFSGFSVYNVFFNHFHEAIIMFPLLLAALDEYMYKRRRGIFALAVAASCIMNYYFFVGMVTFTVIYFVVRMAAKSWRISVRDFLLLALEAVLGLGISCVLLVPSVLAIMQNHRVSNPINGWNAVLYDRNQRYVHILEAFFFPPDLPARPNFTPDSGSKWASLGAWLPLFSMAGVIGWLQLRKKHWLKKILWICFLMAIIPFLNSSFQLMNGSYYARWFYMLTLMMSLATGLSLENTSVDWKRSIKWTTGITLSIALVIGLMPTVTENDSGESSLKFGLEEYSTRFWSYVAISLICIAATVYLIQFCRRNKRIFYKTTMTAVSIVAVLYSMFFIALGKTQSELTYDHIIPYALNGGKNVNIEDLDSCRSDFYESLDNSAMFWEIPSIQAFHSIVPGSVMDFYESIGVQRDVASRPDTTHYALRGLTSVKWLFDDDHDDTFFAGADNASPSMPGYLYYGNANGFDIWENRYYVPMGFTYDSYITREEYDSLAESRREQVMLKAVVLEDSVSAQLPEMLGKLDLNAQDYSEDAYFQDCLNRATGACTQFEYTNTGFRAEIVTQNTELVFFSVPYEDGWSASVNGQPVDIERVNVGFMAVIVPVGENVKIEFTYRTPGLVSGIAVTVFSAALLVLYIYLFKRRLREKAAGPEDENRRAEFLTLGRFSDYAKQNRATFIRGKAMVPKEYRIDQTGREDGAGGEQQ